jgi:hypothetical protein
LKTRKAVCQIVAGVLAGALCITQVAPTAWAQPKPGAGANPPTTGAKPPAAAPPAAGAQPAAGAKPDLTAAKKHYAEGEKRYKAGDYAGALAEFKAADDIKSAPQSQRYIGLCQDGLGHFREAVDAYQKFLDAAPASMSAQADEIKTRVAEIKALPGKVHIETTPSGANVFIDGKPHTAPTPTDVAVPAGHHTVKLSADGRKPLEKEIDVAFASTQSVSAELEAAAAAPPPPVAVTPPPAPPGLSTAPPRPPPEPRSKVPAFVTGGLAVAALGVGAVFGIITLGDKSDFDKNPTSSKADDGENHALITDMAFGVAVTLGVTSLVLFLTRDEAPAAASTSAKPASGIATAGPSTGIATAEPSTARAKKTRPLTLIPTPIVTPHSGGAGLTLRF